MCLYMNGPSKTPHYSLQNGDTVSLLYRLPKNLLLFENIIKVAADCFPVDQPDANQSVSRRLISVSSPLLCIHVQQQRFGL